MIYVTKTDEPVLVRKDGSVSGDGVGQYQFQQRF
jgi:hypothetical protein